MKTAIPIIFLFLIFAAFSCSDDEISYTYPDWIVGTWQQAELPAPDSPVYVFHDDGTGQKYSLWDKSDTPVSFSWGENGDKSKLDTLTGFYVSVASDHFAFTYEAEFTIGGTTYEYLTSAHFYTYGYGIRTGATESYTVFYYPKYPWWTEANIHYYNGTIWTDVPGTAMNNTTGSWFVASNIQAIGGLDCVFNNNDNSWDNPNNSSTNYIIKDNIVWISNSQIFTTDPR